VVATNSGSTEEVIKDRETGMLVPPNDVSGVAKAILTLLKDKQLSRKLGQSGRRLVEERYSWQRMMDVTLKLYSRLYRDKNNSKH